MNKTSLTRALFVAGALAVAGGMAQADVTSYPDGTRVELSESSIDTTTLGAGPSALPRVTTTTVTTTTPVYVFPNIDWDRSTVLLQPHPMMSSARSFELDRTAAATFDVPTRAGEASTMTSGVPNLVTSNESVAVLPAPVVTTNESIAVVPSTVVVPNTSALGAGPSTLSDPVNPTNCGSSAPCSYLPD